MARDEAYHRAEVKIEEAQRSGATELDLSAKWNTQGMEILTELPEALRNLSQLQSLDLSHTKLKEPMEIVSDLTGLRSLSLRGALNGEYDWLYKLTQLRSLNLGSNELTSLPAWLNNLVHLERLDLSNNSLSELPDPLSALTQLRSLDLNFNKLTSLPSWLNNLVHLERLDLSSNSLSELPDPLSALTQLRSLDLSYNGFTSLPVSLSSLTQLQLLNLVMNQLKELPEWLVHLGHLKILDVWGNPLSTLPQNITLLELEEFSFNSSVVSVLPQEIFNFVHLKRLDVSGYEELIELPEAIGQLKNLEILHVTSTQITYIPDAIGNLSKLTSLSLDGNQLIDLPPSLAQLEHLEYFTLNENSLNPVLAAAYKEGLDAVRLYLRLKTLPQVILNEAKLVLVGEGEVGKTCLMDALKGAEWQSHISTHGIEINSFEGEDLESGKPITLNGWDFGGQRVYRPTHQLFFSAPAVYLVVWKPREGPQQGFVKEWIQLVKHREPDAKILVVATHGGPNQRQPDIDRQELWDLFGKDTVIDFFHVDSKPDKNGNRRGIEELKKAIARIAVTLPEVGRSVPKRWQNVREALKQTGAAYLPLEGMYDLCAEHGMEEDEAKLFITISHRLGHLIYYEHDPALQDIVVLKPDWLATAISFVLDDEATRKANGLVRFSHLSQLWKDPAREAENRYPAKLHHIFLRLMERYDLSYKVAGLGPKDASDPVSLIAQLVPDVRPEAGLAREWPDEVSAGDYQQMQLCQIVDQKGQSASAEGLFFQLIVRLHKYSLGRVNYNNSVHWQRGLVLDDDYNGRALLEHIGNDVRITVRAPYPQRFLTMLTEEVKYLVESFWEGLNCDVMVPCIELCGRKSPGTGLYKVEQLIDSKRQNFPKYPCPVCNVWQDIDQLLRNAPAAHPVPTDELISNHEILLAVRQVAGQIGVQHQESIGRFNQLDAGQRELLSMADAQFNTLIQVLTDEAKEGPRLFSFTPVNRTKFNPREWTSSKFQLTLWCEHSRKPLPMLNGENSKDGVYEIELTRDWFKRAAPFLKVMTGTLSLVLPVASSGLKLADAAFYTAFEDELDFASNVIDASLSGGEKVADWLKGDDGFSHEAGRAQGATLRELHAWLKEKDPGFGGLVRVRNKRQEFLWVHSQFEKEY